MQAQRQIIKELLRTVGIDGLYGSVVARKFCFVYGHWILAAMFLVATVAAVYGLVSRRRYREIEPGVGRFALLVAYLLGGALFFFNRINLTHATLRWTWMDYAGSVTRSIVVAAIPCIALFVYQGGRKSDTIEHWPAFAMCIPVAHTLMAVPFIFGSIVMIE